MFQEVAALLAAILAVEVVVGERTLGPSVAAVALRDWGNEAGLQ